MRNVWSRLLAAVLVLAVVGGGGYWYWQRRAVQAAAQQRPRYVTARVQRGTVESVVTGTGPVASINGVTVKANQVGTVVRVNAKDGDQVPAGFVVVELQNDNLTAALAQAQVEVQKAQDDLHNLLNPDPTAVRAQELKVQAAALTLQQRQADVAALQVTAPCSCVVVDTKVKPGDSVAANTLLVTLYDDSQPSVVAQVPQSFAVHIRPGQAAEVTVSGMGARTGTVATVGVQATVSGRDATVPVTITLPAWFGIRPGMAATVQLVPELKQDLGTVQVTGAVSTADIREVRAKVAGDVAAVKVQPGERVAQGDLLVQLQNDSLVHQLRQAENDLAVQQLNLEYLKNPQKDPSGQVRQLQAKLQSALITLQSRQKDVEDLAVKAPVAGQISSLNLRVGDRVTAGTNLFRVADYKGMQVDINVDELDVAKVKPGMPATVTLDALPGRTYRARVLKVNPEGTYRNDIANFVVTVVFEETEGLMAGMNATVNIQVDRRENVLWVPAQAVTVQQGQARVRVVRDGQATWVPIQIGLRTPERVEVVSGLREGDEVVLAEVRQNQAQGFGLFGRGPGGLGGGPGGPGGFGGGHGPGGAGGAPGAGQGGAGGQGSGAGQGDAGAGGQGIRRTEGGRR